jgi:hypothetical protein
MPKDWPPATTTAQGLMTAITANFSQFGNYEGGFGPLGIPFAQASVKFGQVPVTSGATISITNVNHDDGFSPDGTPVFVQTIKTSVVVDAVSATSFTFDTVSGHVLHPASITFSAVDTENGQVGFSIQVQGDFANSMDEWFYYLGGTSLEDNIWNNFVNNVKNFCSASH